MDALKFNKIAAAILCGCLLILGFGKLGDFLVHPNTSVNNAYPIKVAENAAEAIKEVTVTVIEPILAMLSGADIEAGQKIAKKCSACHGFESGGANKVGPNLYDIVGREQGKADFAYSKVFLAM